MAHFHDNALIGASGQGGYQILRSLRFNSADSAYLNRTPASAGNRRTWTWSAWVKRGNSSNSIFSTNSSDNLSYNYFGFSSDSFRLYQWNGSGYDFHLITTAVFRDQSAWYHFAISVDTTQATAGNRVRLYVNGVEVTAFSTNTTPSQNLDTYVNSSSYSHLLGRNPGGSSSYFDGYLTEINFIDGQALTPSSFGETDTITGVWKPKKYTGTYGTNGFYLNFADNSGTTSTTLGKDSSGNGNNWTPNNFSVTAGAGNDSLIDTPTPYADGGNGRGNYCTGNPLYTPSSNSRMSLTNGNLEWGQAATNTNSSMAGTFEMRSGKWYWEVTVGGSFNYSSLGIQTTANTAWRGGGTVLYRSDGQKVIGGTNSAYGSSFTTNDVIGFAYDADAGTLTCYKNNTSQGTIYSSGTGNSWVPCIHDDNAGSGVTYYHLVNFGQRPFAYTPPSGFVALNTQNLPEPSIKKPSSYFDASLYTGNGGSSVTTVTNSGFQPGLVWLKARSSAYDHKLVDAVRGSSGGIYYDLQSNSSGAESLPTAGITSLTSNGFTISAASNNGYNGNGTTFVAWQWQESATPGFDIVTYTGNGTARTIAHSLGVAPSMMIIKTRTTAGKNWAVYHAANGTPQNNVVYLNQTAGTNSSAGQWNSTAPTSSVFSVSGSPSSGYDDVNLNGDNYVAYLWSEVAGFSKFGSYSGTGSADGPFLYCGFRPAFVIIKSSSSGYDWFMFDNKRNPSNVVDIALFPNVSGADSGPNTYMFDFTSNGIKIRNSLLNLNGSGNTYIFCAWAESPFKYSLAR